MEVTQNLHWLSGLGINAYLVEEDDGWVLFDTGMWGRPNPLDYLQTLGHKPTALKHIVITHADIDHIGNLAAIQQASGAAVYASAASSQHIVAATYPSHGSAVMNAMLKLVSVKPLAASAITEIADGDTLPFMGGLHVIATPGHTADHHSFFSPSTGIVIAGDAIFGLGGRLTCSPKMASFDYERAKQSALKLADLTPALIACGHGKPFEHSFEDLMALFDEARAA